MSAPIGPQFPRLAPSKPGLGCAAFGIVMALTFSAVYVIAAVVFHFVR